MPAARWFGGDDEAGSVRDALSDRQELRVGKLMQQKIGNHTVVAVVIGKGGGVAAMPLAICGPVFGRWTEVKGIDLRCSGKGITQACC